MGTERPAKRDRSDSSIWLICVLTAALIITGICWRIHVSQIRQSKITSDRNYHELNSSLQSKLSALNSNLSDLKQMHSELCHQFCELLTSRRDQACPQDWIRNEDRCYFISTLATTDNEAKKRCSNFDARLLKINSKQEENVVSNALVHQHRTYWIGKCEDGEEASSLMYTRDTGTSICGTCDSSEWRNHCNRQHPFICEKRAHLCTDIPEKIQDLCRQSLGAT
ncbi:C-type lectin domain family 2 member B-like [Hemitrygon akajei]|uniref:C-type lectin domain family 2 member B-like n=1 Tax=Hemitrygon akajei TaxID=2704970 RepID=UPI003BF99B77